MEKQEYRSYFKTIRSQLSNTDWSQGVCRDFSDLYHEKNGVIGLYHPFGSELSPQPLVQGVGAALALPRMVAGQVGVMHFHQWDGMTETLEQESMSGLMQPRKDTRIVVPSLLLVPLLACDLHGNRLGYGGGYYDRYLEKKPGCIAVGVGFDEQLYDGTLPAQPHDHRLDAFVSPTQLIRFRS